MSSAKKGRESFNTFAKEYLPNANLIIFNILQFRLSMYDKSFIIQIYIRKMNAYSENGQNKSCITYKNLNILEHTLKMNSLQRQLSCCPFYDNEFLTR